MESGVLWVEKYRPKALEDLILSDEHRDSLRRFLDEGAIPHLLLVGAVGSGKTTISRILVDSIDCSHLELNASDERGIDTVRNRVKSYLQAQGLARWRIVFMDEADALTHDAQFSLRNLMERFSQWGRFILTANYEEKIIEPIRSRCQTLRFDVMNRKEIFKRATHILETEGVEFDPEVVLQVVDDFYPDVRRMINTLQLSVRSGEIVYKGAANLTKDVREALKKRDLRSIRQIVMTYKPDYTKLYRGLFDTIEELTTQSRASVAITIAEYLYRDSFVADREINFAACCLEIMKEL